MDNYIDVLVYHYSFLLSLCTVKTHFMTTSMLRQHYFQNSLHPSYFNLNIGKVNIKPVLLGPK